MTVFRILLVAAAVAAMSGEPAPARAQEKKDGVIRLEQTTIEGRVQKPNAFFINTRQGLVYESLEVRERFVDEIPRVVEDGAF